MTLMVIRTRKLSLYLILADEKEGFFKAYELIIFSSHLNSLKNVRKKTGNGVGKVIEEKGANDVGSSESCSEGSKIRSDSELF